MLARIIRKETNINAKGSTLLEYLVQAKLLILNLSNEPTFFIYLGEKS